MGGFLIQTECQNDNNKKAIRIITCGKYNSHTEPLFKRLNILKVDDIFTSQRMSVLLSLCVMSSILLSIVVCAAASLFGACLVTKQMFSFGAMTSELVNLLV